MSRTNTDETKKIPLGSGNVYLVEYTPGMTIPTDETIETDKNMIGHTQSGANLEYKATYYSAESDDGLAKKKKLVSESVKFNWGLCTWTGDTLKKIASTVRTEAANGKRTTKIGGIKNYDGKKYLLRFVCKDPVDGDMRVTLIGSNEDGFSFAFANNSNAKITPAFVAEPLLDDEGTLVMIGEETSAESG